MFAWRTEQNTASSAPDTIPGGKMRIILLNLPTLQIYHAQYKLHNF